jgi:transposase-like protein
MSKYKPTHAAQLRKGLRKDGKTIAEICCKWNISEQIYYRWIKKYPKFEEAHEIGKMHEKAFWAEKVRKLAIGESEGNAQLMTLAAKTFAGWTDKQEIHHTHDEAVSVIRIEMIGVPKAITQTKQIDIEPDE